MRNAIIEYIELSDDEKKELLNTATIVFDTNVLLNLYRYSKETREIFLFILDRYKERLWLPHQVANEFMKNRIITIEETIDKYNVQKDAGDRFINNCISNLRLDKDDVDFQGIRSSILDLIDKKRRDNLVVLSSDKDIILDNVLELFDQKVGSPYDERKIKEIEKEGKDRYERHLPPGYMDKNKTKDKNINNAYGDLIIWQQIIDYAKDNKKDIIFVTDDRKEDWWNIIHGKTIGPRIELRKEFSDSTGQKFHMYQMDQFITIASKGGEKMISDKVMSEIDAFSSKPEIAEMGLIGMYEPGIIEKIKQEIQTIMLRNMDRNSSLLGYKTLIEEGTITPKQEEQFRRLVNKIAKDEQRIAELKKELHRLRIIGLGNL